MQGHLGGPLGSGDIQSNGCRIHLGEDHVGQIVDIDRRIAVGAIDHNAFIYRATSTGNPWPFVIITAPKGSLGMPAQEITRWRS